MNRILTILLLSALTLRGASFYVDSGVGASGNGSEGSPWKLVANINWSTIQTALASEPVTVYFSATNQWAGNGHLIVGTHHASNPLTLDGESWHGGSGAKALLQGDGAAGGTLYIDEGRSNIVVRGFDINLGRYGGIVLGQGSEENPVINLNTITITNCTIRNVLEGSGVSLLFGEEGCHSIRVLSCTITNVPSEAIYLGHYTYMAPTFTNCVVAQNTIVDTGIYVEGEIEIKSSVDGALIYSNRVYRSGAWPTETYTGGSCGVVVASSNCRIFANEFYRNGQKDDGDWGYGIYVTGEGMGYGSGGQAVTNTHIYNNVIWGNEMSGIRLLATEAQGSVEAWIYNNTFVSNTQFGVEVRSPSGRPVIAHLTNNIFVGNLLGAIQRESGDAVVYADYNLYGPGQTNTFAWEAVPTETWQAQGQDANGVWGDPMLTATYGLQEGSPAIGAALVLPDFTTDKLNGTRGEAWDIGAIEFASTPAEPPVDPDPPSVSSGAIRGRGYLRGNGRMR